MGNSSRFSRLQLDPEVQQELAGVQLNSGVNLDHDSLGPFDGGKIAVEAGRRQATNGF